MYITNDIRYIGVNDHEVDLFEGQYVVPNGMSYNSYVILDEKVAVMDTVDRNFGEEWLNNLRSELGERKPDFLVVQHMEPDHSSLISLILDIYPGILVVADAKAVPMLKGYYGLTDDDFLVVKFAHELGHEQHCTEHTHDRADLENGLDKADAVKDISLSGIFGSDIEGITCNVDCRRLNKISAA